MQFKKLATLLAVLLLTVTVSAANPQSDPVTGKYVGVAKSAAIGDIPITVTLKNDGGKITGSVDTPNGPASITSGTFSNGKLMMKLDAGGNEITINAKLEGDKITGEWELAGQTGTLELKRDGAPAGAPAGTPSTPSMPAAAGDPITGDWDATVDVQGQQYPFTLKLKLEGDKVTGSSNSEQGSTPVNNGTFKDGKLSFSLDTPGGAVSMTAMVKDGKMTGDFDFSGQFQGKWEAKKK
ncbi:MAG: hypothetical protein AB1631_17105 [Acidobacteriota bacterium]